MQSDRRGGAKVSRKRANELERQTMEARKSARLTVNPNRASKVYDKALKRARAMTRQEQAAWKI